MPSLTPIYDELAGELLFTGNHDSSDAEPEGDPGPVDPEIRTHPEGE